MKKHFCAIWDHTKAILGIITASIVMIIMGIFAGIFIVVFTIYVKFKKLQLGKKNT